MGIWRKWLRSRALRKLGKLAALLPATELGGARVPEEGCELLPGDTPLPPRDPESIRDGQRMYAHSIEGSEQYLPQA